MKVVINRCYGGFGLSQEAEQSYKERKGITDPNWFYWEIARNDEVLVELVEQMGPAVNSRYSDLAIVDIPDDVNWEIEEYDGREWVAEVHRIWR
jgi:hypothetical protein